MPGRAMGAPRPHAFRRRLAIAIPLALVGMLVLTSAASAGLLAPEAGGSKNADAIRFSAAITSATRRRASASSIWRTCG